MITHLGENVEVATSRRAHEVSELCSKTRGEHRCQLLAVCRSASPTVRLQGARQVGERAWVGLAEALGEGTGADGGAERITGRRGV
jgi:hypothetical protein